MKSSLSKERIKNLNEFCHRVNIKFKDVELLNQAFNHRSVTNEKKSEGNNERLEFLGDSVLGMVTSSYLYNTLDNPEGELAKIKSAVVSEKALAPIAIKLGIDKLIVLGHGEELSGGKFRKAIVADIFEAFIGAMFLDSGLENVKKFIYNYVIPMIENNEVDFFDDYKSVLQELVQTDKKSLEYVIMDMLT